MIRNEVIQCEDLKEFNKQIKDANDAGYVVKQIFIPYTSTGVQYYTALLEKAVETNKTRLTETYPNTTIPETPIRLYGPDAKKNPCEECDFHKKLLADGKPYIGDSPCEWCSKNPWKPTWTCEAGSNPMKDPLKDPIAKEKYFENGIPQ